MLLLLLLLPLLAAVLLPLLPQALLLLLPLPAVLLLLLLPSLAVACSVVGTGRSAMASSAVAQRAAGLALASRAAWQENSAAGARLLAALCNSLIETRSVRSTRDGEPEQGKGEMVLASPFYWR